MEHISFQRSTNETPLTFLWQGNILSGIWGKGENVTLYFTGSPYKTDGTLIIDGYLEIKANVTIQVKEGSSILIRRNGTMKAIGTADMPISFENLDAERWAGLVVEGVADLQHINIKEGGHGGDFCLTIERPSSFVYKNIRIQEGMGNGLSVEGDGDLASENLRIESTTPSLGFPKSVYIAGQERTNVDINGLFISMSHSGYAIWAHDIPRLSIKNAEIYPLSVLSDTPSLYLAAGSYELDNFVFKASSQTHWASIRLAAKDGSITNSYIIGTGLLDADVGGRYNYYNYIRDGYVKINNVTFVGTNINANANNISFVKNSFSGSTNINANANNISFVKNSFSGVLVMVIAYTMIFALYPSTNSPVKNLRPVKYNKMKMLKRSYPLISTITLFGVLVCVRSQAQKVSLQSAVYSCSTTLLSHPLYLVDKRRI
jgi:hypothetical protein